MVILRLKKKNIKKGKCVQQQLNKLRNFDLRPIFLLSEYWLSPTVKADNNVCFGFVDKKIQ